MLMLDGLSRDKRGFLSLKFWALPVQILWGLIERVARKENGKLAAILFKELQTCQPQMFRKRQIR